MNFHLFNETNSLKNMVGQDYRFNHEEVMWNFDVEVFDHVIKQLREGDVVQFERYTVKINSLVSSHRLGTVDLFSQHLITPLNEISRNYNEGNMDTFEKNVERARERLVLTNKMLTKIRETLEDESNKKWFEELSNHRSELNRYISERWTQAFHGQGRY